MSREISANAYLGETYRRKFGSGEDNKPSRQQVEPQKTYGAMDIAYAAGRAAAFKEAVGAVDKRHEQIAKVMGWEVMPANRIWQFRDKDRRTFSLHHWECVKAMQQRMVEDGWDICINCGAPGFMLTAEIMENGRQITPTLMTNWCKTEPAAILSLFEKIYGGGR